MDYLLLIHGMLIQLADATAAKGTILPTTGGNFCNKHVHPEMHVIYCPAKEVIIQ